MGELAKNEFLSSVPLHESMWEVSGTLCTDFGRSKPQFVDDPSILAF